MTAFGWVLILLGALFVRQAAIGRAVDLPGDTSDAFTDLVRGDWDGLAEVTGRRGESVPLPASAGAVEDPGAFGSGSGGFGGSFGSAPTSPTVAGGSLVSEMQRLAKGANYRYVWGATGPNGYDCSGLVWRAMKNLGIFTGSRFTTSSWNNVAPDIARRVDVPAAGDVVNWPGQHMGVYIGGGKMYAAKSARSGIGTQDVASARRSTPDYWRLGTRSPAGPGGSIPPRAE